MIPTLRTLTSPQRTALANLRLGSTLAFVAGATNAGGFLAVGLYTSHMTGLVSQMADNLALGHGLLALTGLSALLAFVLGAISSSILVDWALRRRLKSHFALPLMLEAMLLLVFGLLGAVMGDHFSFLAPYTVLLLCYIMGLQNALITRISLAEIRTTHITGLITDLGIELGKLLYINHSTGKAPVLANRKKMRIHATLICAFVCGGFLGALGFKHWGYQSTLVLALLLIGLSILPLLDDAKARFRLFFRHSHPSR
jgi:uncharacterized membrane protein YoaK (UPF0700 family)